MPSIMLGNSKSNMAQALLYGLGVAAAILLLVGGRAYVHESLHWGMGSDGHMHLMSVLVIEFAFLAVVALISVSSFVRLARQSWPAFIVVLLIALSLGVLSSPLLFQFESWWVTRGWQIAEVVNLMGHARNILAGFLIALLLMSRRNPK